MVLFNAFIIKLEEGVRLSPCSWKLQVVLCQDVVWTLISQILTQRGPKRKGKIRPKQEPIEKSNVFRSILIYLFELWVEWEFVSKVGLQTWRRRWRIERDLLDTHLWELVFAGGFLCAKFCIWTPHSVSQCSEEAQRCLESQNGRETWIFA